jgi:hypothetical protein
MRKIPEKFETVGFHIPCRSEQQTPGRTPNEIGINDGTAPNRRMINYTSPLRAVAILEQMDFGANLLFIKQGNPLRFRMDNEYLSRH